MIRTLTICLFIWIVFALPSAWAGDIIPGRVDISFDYNRATPDYANNQFAVWIEDMKGDLLKTLFVTDYTASDGWKIRKEALPVWTKKANRRDMTKKAVDAVSGATPKSQRLVFSWEEKSGSRSGLPRANTGMW